MVLLCSNYYIFTSLNLRDNDSVFFIISGVFALYYNSPIISDPRSKRRELKGDKFISLFAYSFSSFYCCQSFKGSCFSSSFFILFLRMTSSPFLQNLPSGYAGIKIKFSFLRSIFVSETRGERFGFYSPYDLIYYFYFSIYLG